MEATDWSWGALIFDMNMDGRKDLFVANGIYKDLLDQDYVNFYSNPERVRELIRTEEQAILKLIDEMPSEPLANYAFQNKGDLTFVNVASAWGLDAPGFSNGSAYGDLDNDGVPDLVVNNNNMPPFIYRNRARDLQGGHSLSVQLKGEGYNTFGLGAQLTLYAGDETFYQEQAPMRGFQSCVDHRLHFGLGQISEIDSLVVIWNAQERSVLTDIQPDQLLVIEQAASGGSTYQATEMDAVVAKPFFQELPALVDYEHRESEFSDFDRDRLLFHMRSAEGPKMARTDVNGDGLDDIFIGGAKNEAGALYIQISEGRFSQTNEALFATDKISEDSDCLFFDADGDGDADLYVASGGNEFPSSSSALVDRLYINDGKGQFTKSPQILPSSRFESTSCVRASDFDGDGDLDLFVGIRLRPFLYGVPASSYLLENDGQGKFKNISEQRAPDLKHIGLVTDAQWVDYDLDNDDDLILVGEWMPVTILENDQNRLTISQTQDELNAVSGFWNCIQYEDLDRDGDFDLVVGNLGLNSRFTATDSSPIHLYVNDFDGNRTVEQILTSYEDGRAYPMVLRNDLVMQLPNLKKKYLKYQDYREQSMAQIFSPEQMEKAIELSVTETRSMLFINQGSGRFEAKALPLRAQFAPIYGIALEDFDRDGNIDILLGGNFYRSKPEVGIYDATYGVFLRGDGQMNFDFTPAGHTGLMVKGEIRDFCILDGKLLLVARNNESLKTFEY